MTVTPIRVFDDPVLLAPEHRRAAMRIVREADWAGGPPSVVRSTPHANAFGRR
ncbi:MAG TPA: hypothetical protein VE503_09545 [Ornithinibacter sp.]|nr:hypothetical protein [Ornithinibacter sp.]